MEVIEKTIRYKQGDGDWKVYPIGDSHLGIKHCTESDLQKIVKEIEKDPTAIWIGMGDYGEFITPKDKRWDSKVVAEWLEGKQDNIAEEQTKHIVNLFTPIKDKCIGLIEGNHEDSIRRFLHTDVQVNICERLGLTNLGYSCWVKLRFCPSETQTHVYKCVFSHGSGWAITPGAKMNRLQRFMNSFDARIYAMAHMHDVITHTVPYLELSDSNNIRQKERVGAVTGCWFKAYAQGVAASYGEKRGYPPTSLGCPVFTINPTTDTVRVHG